MVLEEAQEGNAKASRGCLLWAHRQRLGHRELCQASAVWRLAVDEDFTFLLFHNLLLVDLSGLREQMHLSRWQITQPLAFSPGGQVPGRQIF